MNTCLYTGVSVLSFAFSLSCGSIENEGLVPLELGIESAPIAGGTLVTWPTFSVEVSGCSAVAIHPRALLTAGHCNENSPSLPVMSTFVRAHNANGNVFLAFQGNAVWYRRSDYNGTTATDIALVVLPLPLPDVITATMWNGAVSVNTAVQLFGWGNPNDQSRQFFTSLSQVSSTRLVHVNGSVGQSCTGDSGGPWVDGPHVVGLSSHSQQHLPNGCAPIGKWSDAHRLSASMDLIRSHFLFSCDKVGEPWFVPNGTGNQFIDCRTDETYYMGPLVNATANKCVDARADSSASQTAVQIFPCNNGPAQQWYYSAAERAIRFRDKMCVDVQGGNLSDGTPVWLWPCSGNAAQRWIRQNGPGSPTSSFKLENTNLCLDAFSSATSAQLQIKTCDGSNSQRFTFE